MGCKALGAYRQLFLFPDPRDGRGPACLYCGTTRTHRRRRGLCWRCHRSDRVRARFNRRWTFAPTAGPLGRDFPGQPMQPREATQAAPGTREKVEVMASRYAARRSLHDDDDVREPMTQRALDRALELFTLIGQGG